MTWPRKQLPPVPTGYEYFDLLWSQLIPAAPNYLAVLPRSADPVWASVEGLRYAATSLLRQWAESEELECTPSHSTPRRVRDLQGPLHGVVLGSNGCACST
jgi:hypothetical protein